MRSLFTILIIGALLSPILVKTGKIVWYLQNKTSITVEFCVNKDNPEMNCHGKCHLKKEIQKVEWKVSKQTHQPPAVIQTFDDHQFCSNEMIPAAIPAYKFLSLINYYNVSLSKGYPTLCFVPPQYCV